MDIEEFNEINIDGLEFKEKKVRLTVYVTPETSWKIKKLVKVLGLTRNAWFTNLINKALK